MAITPADVPRLTVQLGTAKPPPPATTVMPGMTMSPVRLNDIKIKLIKA